MTARPLLLTPGDVHGIGPEVSLRALASLPLDRPVVVVGDGEAIRREAAAAGVDLPEVSGLDTPLPPLSHMVPTGDEPVEIAAIRWATRACLADQAAALVTGPIHKARMAARGFHHAGHTDFLGELCGVPNPVMAFVGGDLRVALVTVHLPLRAVPDAVTTPAVLHTIRTAAAALTAQLSIEAPKLLVCGLNPHAGDEGLLGQEDADVIAPAVVAAQAEGIDAVGPISSEAAFRAAMAGDGDLVVAMYHDQGLAPLKAVDFGRSVNWTLGLPIIRTSVDHGTADDIAGQGLADPTSMQAALAWAAQLADLREA